MKKFFLFALACAIASFFGLSLQANEVMLDPLASDGTTYESIVPCEACGSRGACVVDCEATFLRYHRNANLANDDIFGFELSPRLAVGYQTCDGLGVRARYWAYDHANFGFFGDVVIPEEVTLRVDTYNVDLELYKQVQITCDTSCEVSAGVRYNAFYERVDFESGLPPLEEIFNTYGAVLGLKGRCQIGSGAGFVRWRTSLLMDNQVTVGGVGPLFDQVRTQTELAMGYEHTCCMGNAILTLRGGIEYQYWTDYVHDFIDFDNRAVGFGGFVAGAVVQF